MKALKIKRIPAIIIGIMLVVGIIYPLITPYSAEDFSFETVLTPSFKHLLGTDEMGHDIFSMLLVGFRVTIGTAIAAAVLSTLIGATLALLCAYFKGVVDKIILRITELFVIVPEIVILMFFAAFAKPSLINTILAIAFFSWSKACRIIRAKAMVAVESDKVKYTILLKGGLFEVLKKLWREIYPTVSTMFVLQCSRAAVYEATLAFFGIGDPMIKSWGRIIKTAMDYSGIFDDKVYLFYLIPPILCICIFVVALSHISFEGIGEEA